MTEELTMGLLLGLFFGAVVGIFIMIGLILSGFFTHDEQYYLDKYTKAQHDCKIPEYYYLDQHRTYCDKIGVKP